MKCRTNSSYKLLIIGISIALAAWLAVLPSIAYADSGEQTIQGNMTISLDNSSSNTATANYSTSSSNSTSSLTSTGDAQLWLGIAFASIAIAGLYIAIKSRSLKSSSGSHSHTTLNKHEKTRMIAIIATAAIVTVVSLTMYVNKSTAVADEQSPLATSNSEVVVDLNGEVKSANFNIINNSDSNLLIESVYAPDDLEGWLLEAASQELAASGTYSANWTGEKVSSEVVSQLMSNGGQINETYAVKVASAEDNADTVSVTFVANAPEGFDAQVDGSNESKVDLKATGNSQQFTLTNDSFPKSVEITSDDSQNYIFAGWSTDANDTVHKGISQDQLIGKTLTDDVTYYAIWMRESGYWMGTKDANESYKNEAYFATHDSNYMSSADIQADMKVLHDKPSRNRRSVITKWCTLYANDIRLYATYKGGEKEVGWNNNPASELNKYVEFRIIEVSYNPVGHDRDGSAVTFMATHALPTAWSISDSTNAGGWGSSEIMKRLNGGDDYNKFSSDFVNSVKSVAKKYGTGNGSMATATGNYKFWLLSQSEIAGNWNPYETRIVDGVQYKWFYTNRVGVKIKETNRSYPCIANMRTRSGGVPGNSSNALGFWWTRTPDISSNSDYLAVDYTGNPFRCFLQSGWKYSIVPAFCF